MQEQALSRPHYLQALLSHLRDLPRSGTRKRITLEEEQEIIALSTEKPKDYGVEISDWTHEMLATVAITKGIVAKISSRHVGNILKKHASTPQVRVLALSQDQRLDRIGQTGKADL